MCCGQQSWRGGAAQGGYQMILSVALNGRPETVGLRFSLMDFDLTWVCFFLTLLPFFHIKWDAHFVFILEGCNLFFTYMGSQYKIILSLMRLNLWSVLRLLKIVETLEGRMNQFCMMDGHESMVGGVQWQGVVKI